MRHLTSSTGNQQEQVSHLKTRYLAIDVEKKLNQNHQLDAFSWVTRDSGSTVD